MPDPAPTPDPVSPPPLSRRESLRMAAILALGAGLGVPAEALGMTKGASKPMLKQIVFKFQKDRLDGGQVVGSITLPDTVTAFLASTAGARAHVKWYDSAATLLGDTTVTPELYNAVRQQISTSGD